MKRAFIIHGYGATPEDHWFSWLAQQLQAAGVATAIPALPDPEQPDFDRWQAALTTHLGTPDAQTFYVAHSLGTISLKQGERHLVREQRARLGQPPGDVFEAGSCHAGYSRGA